MARAPRPAWHPVEPTTQAAFLVGLGPVARHVYAELLAVLERVLPFAIRMGVLGLAEAIEREPAEVAEALRQLEAAGLVERDDRHRIIFLPKVLAQVATAPPNP